LLELIKLFFYGGVEGVIGGNQILLEDGSTRILLDYGLNYSLWRDYFEYVFAEPGSVKELEMVGLIPHVEVLRGLDACFITHPHGDHYGMMTTLPDENVRVYTGEVSQRIIESKLKTRRKRRFEKIEHLDFKAVHSGYRVNIGSITVEFQAVDHSIPGSYSLIVETSSGSLLYVGDFRTHGVFKPRVDVFKLALDRQVKAVICEGTNVGQLCSPLSEKDVENGMVRILSECNSLAIVDMSPGDVDRLRTVCKVASTLNRNMVVTKRHRAVLEALQGVEGLNAPEVGKDVLDYEDAGEELRKSPSDYILCTSFYNLREVVDLSPPPGSIYVLSSSEPFEEETFIAFKRLQNWLNLLGAEAYHIHSSGHAYPWELRRGLMTLRELPGLKLFPIHTEYPEAFRSMFNRFFEVIVPIRGACYVI
jgi:ribonuclease J